MSEPISPYEKEIELPSRGQFYNGKVPGGKVKIRPISVAEEKLFFSPGSRMAIADRVLQRCVVSEALPLKDMLISDKYYLLLMLRCISYGESYTFSLQCHSCGTAFNHTLLIPRDLQLRVATPEDKEPFDVKLPLAGKTISIRFLRGSDEATIADFIKQLPNVRVEEEGDPAYAFRMALLITAIDGKEVEILERLRFCEALVGRDSLAIRRAIVAHETGPDLLIKSSCPSCHTAISSTLPLTNEFFPAESA